MLCQKKGLFDTDNKNLFKIRIENNTNAIRQNVRSQFDASKDAYFLKYYFDILYLELTTFYINNFKKLLIKMYENKTVKFYNNIQT